MLLPPNTTFYRNPRASNLWRDLSQLYEGYGGAGGEYTRSFLRVLSDLSWRLVPMPCARCSTSVENVAPDSGTLLRCPSCGWEPVQVRQVEIVEAGD